MPRQASWPFWLFGPYERHDPASACGRVWYSVEPKICMGTAPSIAKVEPRPVRVGVLGCGHWGQNLVRNLANLGALAAVCDPDSKSRQRATELAPEVPALERYEAVLADPDIDAIVIATPAETHFTLASEALEHGKDVLVEKPLCVHYTQGCALHRLAEKTGRILMVGHMLEYHPAVLRLRQLMAQGDLGRTSYIYSNRLNFGKVRTEENALWSFAPHDVAVILRLVGEEPIEVTCCGGSYITPNLADVTISCLHFRTGLRAHIFVSWLNPFKEQKLVVVGDRKMAVFDDVSRDEKLVLYHQHVDLNERQPVLQRNGAEIIPIAAGEPLRAECERFLESVLTRRPPLTDSRSGVSVLRVLEACQISLQLNGRPIQISDVREAN
jgi:predicted dehydrogenase